VRENLKDYILHLDKWIPQNIIDKSIKELLNNNTWKQHQYHEPKNPDKLFSKNGNKELDIAYAENLTHLKELYDLTWKALERYIVIDKIGGDT